VALAIVLFARACKIGRATVRDYLDRAEKAELSWTQVEQMNEADLEDALFPKAADRSKGKIIPDWSYIYQELKRKGVTLRLLWQEWYQSNPQAAYSYSQFCNLYRAWSKKLTPVMVQSYKGGELLFVDYAGLTVPYVERISGEQGKAQVFVAALGASSYTYAEAQKGQDLVSWISGHVNSFEYFGGIPEIVVPDYVPRNIIRIYLLAAPIEEVLKST
jgi:transposase